MTSPQEISAAGTPAAAGVARGRSVRILQAGLGAFIALAALGLLAAHSGQAWLLGSFGAS